MNKETAGKAGRSKRQQSPTVFNRITVVLIVVAALFLMLNMVLRIESNSIAMNRYRLSYNATRFLNASTYLTAEARAYANTQDKRHYENYLNETDVLRNREESVANLRELGITEAENALVVKMMELSDSLTLIENEAAELVKNGTPRAASELLYSEEYTDAITQLTEVREELRFELDERTTNSLDKVTAESNLVSILTWIIAGAVVVMQYVQKRILYDLAYVDPLTKAPNYAAFREKMRSGMDLYGRGYVIAADLKNFSIINDVCGVARGDEIICIISRILQKQVGKGELVAHLGGDRFALFLQCADDDAVVERITQIRNSLMNSEELTDIPYMLPVFGVRHVENTLRPERAYGYANMANRNLKRSDREGFYAFFDKAMQAQLLENSRLEDTFEVGIEKHQFEVWYQPKYEPRGNKLAAAEALVRWRRDGNLVPPGKFIPLFERNGMIARLDEYVFTEVCAQLRAWTDSGIDIVPVSVNVSRSTLMRSNVADRYIEIMKTYDIPVDYVELELTESVLSGGVNIEKALRKLRRCGIHILVDDFCSGYSSLSTLTSDTFDGIKIDKSLVDCTDTPSGKYLLEAIVKLAHKFELDVTAEGAEKAQQVEYLRNLSCDLIQGFYYSRPLIPDDMNKLLINDMEMSR